LTVFTAATATGRKRRGEGHTRRDEILHAAKELFLEQGYDSTTIRKIADRVGISAPALYLYFRDKEALLLALCDQTFGHLIVAIDEIERTVAEPLERVRRFGEAYARFGLTHPDEYRLIFMGAHIPESLRKVGHRMPTDDPTRPGVGGALVFSRLVAILKQVEASGVELRYPADTCAELCWMGIHGVVAAMIMKPDFPWSNRDLLIGGMLDIVAEGIVREG
jgi:AcrR family transcriptional regulator